MDFSDGLKGIRLLIGLGVPRVLVSLEERRGDDYEPFALRTLLGWMFLGPVGTDERTTKEINCYLNLEGWVQHKRKENLCWESDLLKKTEEAMSMEDKKVLNLWTTSVRKVNGYYQLPISFRLQETGLPDTCRL